MSHDGLLEKDIQKQILDYLKIRGIFHWRNNVGAGKLQGGRFVQFGVAGAPDIFALHKGVSYGIEVKRPGKKQSELQKYFGDRMNEAGGHYQVVFSLDDVMKFL